MYAFALFFACMVMIVCLRLFGGLSASPPQVDASAPVVYHSRVTRTNPCHDQAVHPARNRSTVAGD